MAQQNTLDFLVAAHVSGQEQMAKLINTVGALQKETERLKDANVALGKSTDTVIQNGKRYNNALDAQSKALRNARQGSQMAMMQFQDFFTSVSTGASPIQAFNQQIGQLGYSLTMMQGRLGAVGRFLSSGWGLVVIGAATALGMFMKSTDDSSKKSIDFAKTAGDAFTSVSDNISNALKPAIEALGPVIEYLSPLFEAFGHIAKAVVKGVIGLINVTIGGIIGAINAAVILGTNSYNMIAELAIGIINTFAGVVNYVISNVENFINNSKGLVNKFLEITGSSFRIAETKFQRMEMVTNKWAGSASKAFGQAGAAFASALRTEYINPEDYDLSYKADDGKKKKGGKGDTSAADAAKREAERLAKIQQAIDIRNAKSKEFWAEYWSDREDEIARDSIDRSARVARELGYITADFNAQQEEQIQKPYEALQDSFRSIGQTVSDAFKGMITGATSWKDAMRGIINSVIDQLWQLYVVQQIVGFVTKALGKVGAPLPGPVESVSPFMKAANGTINSPGGLTWVGERGPELLNLPRGSQVIPAHRAQSMGGGGVTVNVDARGSADPAAVRAQVEAGIMQAAPAIIAAAQQRTVAGLRRPKLGGAMQ